MKILNFVVALVLALLIANLAKGQSADTPNDGQPKKLIRIIRLEGWDVPQLTNRKLISTESTNIDGLTVTVKMYDFAINTSQSQTIQLDFYGLHNDDLKISSLEADIRNVFVFSVKNKVFAYKLACVPFSFTDGEIIETKEKFKVKSYTRAILNSLYFDEDGDGKFETKYTMSEMPSELPKWVKDLATAN